MLVEFHLRNFVLFEEASLTLAGGFNVISGETGAGKSLLAQALSIVVGRDRFETRHIRTGADSSTLTVVFEPCPERLAELARDFDIDVSSVSEEGLIVERTASHEGRGRTSVNGKPLPLATLREIGERLVDISAQDEHTALRETAVQREMLDRYGSLRKETADTSAAYRRLRELVDELEGGDAARQRRREELDRLRYHIDELLALAPDPESDGQMETRIRFLENASRLRTFCGNAVEELYEADEAVASRLGGIFSDAEDMAACAPELADVAEQIQGAQSLLDEAVRTLRDVESSTDVDDDELERTIERLHALRDLARKHDIDMMGLATVLAGMQARVAELAGRQEEEKNLAPAIARAAKDFRSAAALLYKGRQKAAQKLSQHVLATLARLGMPHAEFEVRFLPLVDAAANDVELARKGSPAGLEEVSFALKANPGESWGESFRDCLQGETARAMLAIKSALATVQPCEVLFFDEIDAGVGGRLGDAIARELELLADNRQVITITHLPQIASHGSRHLCIDKKTDKGRTRTTITVLEEEERVTEIATMLRGDASTATTMAQAREMLGGGNAGKPTKGKRKKKAGAT